jgi:hypothetical protein
MSLFKPGDTVKVRNINPTGYVRVPRYARGKVGVIELVQGEWPSTDFPDVKGGVARATDFIKEDVKEPVYAVRFAARELWGDEASPQDTILIDLWHHYLEPC